MSLEEEIKDKKLDFFLFFFIMEVKRKGTYFSLKNHHKPPAERK